MLLLWRYATGMPTLPEKTLAVYGYDLSRLLDKSSKLVICACDVCGTEFTRRRRFLTPVLICVTCRDKPETKALAATKRKETMLARYGVTGVVQTEGINERRRATNEKRYGGAAPNCSAAVQQKTQTTVQERYGVSNVSQVKEIRDRAADTMQERYGVPYAMMSPEIRAKSVETCQTKYGVDYNTQAEDTKQKANKTRQERYGAPQSFQSPIIREKAKQTNLLKRGVEYPTQDPNVVRKSMQTKLEHYGTLCPSSGYGKAEETFAELIATWTTAEIQRHYILPGTKREFDVYIPEKQLAIEYCGLFWHHELNTKPPKDQWYHWGKMMAAADNGIRLLTVFEDEWKLRQAQVSSVIQAKLGRFDQRIYGRECVVKEIEQTAATVFINDHHIQPLSSNISTAYGLFYADELVGVLTLRHDYQRPESVALNRLCFKGGIQVIGGAGKLLAAITQELRASRYTRITTWSDNRWSTGNIYQTLGFKLVREGQPDYAYVHINRPRVRLTKQTQLKDKTGCPATVTERDWALQRGLARIWDCGHKRWEFQL